MTQHPWFWALALWSTLTAIYSVAQAVENTRNPDGPHWTPVWWVALTWPFWLVVIALDLKVTVTYPNRRAYRDRRDF